MHVRSSWNLGEAASGQTQRSEGGCRVGQFHHSLSGGWAAHSAPAVLLPLSLWPESPAPIGGQCLRLAGHLYK